MNGIKKIELDVCKANIMSNTAMHENLADMVELYSTFTKQMNAENL
jgi:hypothetical protein